MNISLWDWIILMYENQTPLFRFSLRRDSRRINGTSCKNWSNGHNQRWLAENMVSHGWDITWKIWFSAVSSWVPIIEQNEGFTFLAWFRGTTAWPIFCIPQHHKWCLAWPLWYWLQVKDSQTRQLFLHVALLFWSWFWNLRVCSKAHGLSSFSSYTPCRTPIFSIQKTAQHLGFGSLTMTRS